MLRPEGSKMTENLNPPWLYEFEDSSETEVWGTLTIVAHGFQTAQWSGLIRYNANIFPDPCFPQKNREAPKPAGR
jgi:hypothetical protein